MEYTYQNWLKGGFDCDLVYTEYQENALDKNNEKRKSNDFIPEQELIKIQKEQERVFEEHLKQQAAIVKDKLHKQLFDIEDRSYFISEFINYLERMVHQKNDPFNTTDDVFKEIFQHPSEEFVTSFRLLVNEKAQIKHNSYNIVISPIKYKKHPAFNDCILARVYVEIRQYLFKIKLNPSSIDFSKQKKRQEKNKGFQTYYFQRDDKYLKQIFQFLVEEEYIKNDTIYENFKLAFSGKVISQKLNIKWLLGVQDFGIFIMSLFKQNFISKKKYNSIAQGSFLFCIYKNAKQEKISRIDNIVSKIINEEIDTPLQSEKLERFIFNLRNK